MSRPLWFAAGAGAGLYAAVRVRRAAEALSVAGLQDRAGAAVLGLRMLRDEVAQGKADTEHELRERLGVAIEQRRSGRPELVARPAPAIPTTPPTPTTHPEQEVGSS